MLAIVPGSRVPFIFRSTGQPNEAYILVGERYAYSSLRTSPSIIVLTFNSYVRGIMHGEIMWDCTDGKYETKEF